jgi:carbon-monoxide dehydrogenase medium subunit
MVPPDGAKCRAKFITGLFETALKSARSGRRARAGLSAGARRGCWKFCRKTGEFPQAIGGALDDPERGARRLIIGATRGAPYLVADARALISKPDEAALLAAAANADLGDDAYSRRLHAVALRRAIEKLAA